jgi:hypothetical protein
MGWVDWLARTRSIQFAIVIIFIAPVWVKNRHADANVDEASIYVDSNQRSMYLLSP